MAPTAHRRAGRRAGPALAGGASRRPSGRRQAADAQGRPCLCCFLLMCKSSIYGLSYVCIIYVYIYIYIHIYRERERERKHYIIITYINCLLSLFKTQAVPGRPPSRPIPAFRPLLVSPPVRCWSLRSAVGRRRPAKQPADLAGQDLSRNGYGLVLLVLSSLWIPSMETNSTIPMKGVPDLRLHGDIFVVCLSCFSLIMFVSPPKTLATVNNLDFEKGCATTNITDPLYTQPRSAE